MRRQHNNVRRYMQGRGNCSVVNRNSGRRAPTDGPIFSVITQYDVDLDLRGCLHSEL